MNKKASKRRIDDRSLVIEQLRSISVASLDGLFDEDGEFVLPENNSTIWQAVKEIEKVVVSSEEFTKTTFKIKLWDKIAAIRLLCQIQGINGLENMIKSVRSAGFNVTDSSEEDVNAQNKEGNKSLQLAFTDLLN